MELWLTALPRCEHEFGFVEDALFTAMVASQATETLKATNADEIRCYPQIKVIATQQQRMTALVGYQEDNFIRWNAEQIANSSDLRFGTVYDFDTLSGSYRDFRYIFCADVADLQNIRRVLIDAHDAELSEVLEEQP